MISSEKVGLSSAVCLTPRDARYSVTETVYMITYATVTMIVTVTVPVTIATVTITAILTAGLDPALSPSTLINSRPYGIAPPKQETKPFSYSTAATNPLEQAGIESGNLATINFNLATLPSVT